MNRQCARCETTLLRLCAKQRLSKSWAMWFVIPLSHRLLLPAGYLQRKVSTYCSLKYVHTNKRVLSFGTLVGKLAEIDVPRNT
ncbi:hypothetical protein M514_02690, partial [Trichuris suis]